MIDPFRFGPWVSTEAVAAFEADSATAQPAPDGDVVALRTFYDAFNQRHLATAVASYPVSVREDEIADVRVHIVTPESGAVSDQTLLCLHGGAFMWGRGAGALLEAVPVAATSGIRVIAVEYALAPEQIFPAAVEDVLRVYEAVRQEHSPAGIGMYGCSAGGILTAQSVARMLADGIPTPGAIAMLCGTGLEMDGDSAMAAGALSGQVDARDELRLGALPYFAGAGIDDPLVFPGEHPDVLAHFPPSLLVTGTRDFASSSMTVMHRRLLAAGAEASLIQFDGMWHAYHMATTLPEARETFAALTRFFAAHLA
jgi:monoterpene epsilon-lactone hydrolase